MMNFHSSKFPFLWIVATLCHCLGTSPNAIAAEIWLESTVTTPGQMLTDDTHSCEIITNDCEVCITPPGKGKGVCSKLSEECSPTKLTCLESSDTATPKMGQHLLRRSYGEKLRNVSSTESKYIFDRVQQVETFDAEDSVREVIELVEPSQIMTPKTEKLQDRLETMN